MRAKTKEASPMSETKPISFSRDQWADLVLNDNRRMEVDNRRFALDRALQFYKNSVPGITIAEAPVHLAAMFYAYVDAGMLPDAKETAASARETTENIVRMAIPPAARPGSAA